ncbi:hypothetical protein JWS13_17640 [Rhodococcus pseudokoreensis]|uniref:Uncharacterized protein n=1 Tax=Rhodococcus pseudokoreensis TaxID=2811421 RepID=A0A974ZUG0_9NOCA|nr:hypothetical protein [Rhodococcus pseudokoreensis]QSE90312.1 hypothetical protein JWS13_17640 [Rhodococcus pseudokoreensis]
MVNRDDKAPPSYDDLTSMLSGLDDGATESVQLALSMMSTEELRDLSVAMQEVMQHHRLLFALMHDVLARETAVRLAQAHAEGVL